MSYLMEVEMRHAVSIAVPIRDEVIVRYDARLLASAGDEAAPALAGRARFHIVKLGLALDQGIETLGICDSIDQTVHDFAVALLDPDSGQLRNELVDRFELTGGDLMLLEHVEIDSEHRGQQLGLVVADRLIDVFADGLVVCRPAPVPSSELSLAKRLQRYARRLGFAPIDESAEIFGLSTAVKRPAVKLRPRSPTANDNRE